VPPVLEGEKVRLRPVRDDDLAFLHAIANDPDLRGWLRFERPMTESEERAWMAHLHDDEGRVWLIEARASGQRVGVLSLLEWSHVARIAELGVTLGAATDRGAGYGGEACRLALRHAFEDMDLQRVHLNVYEDNPAVRLYRRLGFREEGRLRRHTYKRGAYRDVLLMGLLREEWSG
jgi:RimJ/RimL family protein N-acetyltransferase